MRWSLYNLILKRDSNTGVFLWILRKFSEYLSYRTPGRLPLTFYCNSLIKKNLSNISTIRCLVFFVISQTKVCSWVYFSHWDCSLFLSTSNFKISRCYRKLFQLNHIRTSCFFLLRRSRIVITNLFKSTLLQWKFVYI